MWIWQSHCKHTKYRHCENNQFVNCEDKCKLLGVSLSNDNKSRNEHLSKN